MPYLGYCARAFSIVKQQVKFQEPDLLSYDTPLWHSTHFLNQHRQSYFAPGLTRMGVLTVGQLLEDDSLHSFLAPTWEPVYKQRFTMCPLLGWGAPLSKYNAPVNVCAWRMYSGRRQRRSPCCLCDCCTCTMLCVVCQ